MSWVGGKKALRDEIVSRFPLDYKRYIEVFGGGGWVLFHKNPGKDFEVYNDFNGNLVNLYRCVREHKEDLIAELEFMLNSRLDFEYMKYTLHSQAVLPDIRRAAYYYALIRYSYASTRGTSATTFSPDEPCTRAQAVTFLWRAVGCPTPKGSQMPFKDVVKGSFYETAVLWAVENGITKGTSSTTFTPDATCNRAQFATLLWRFRGMPDAGTTNPFTDVPEDTYYTDAVLWAVEKGITNGTSATTFSPDEDCTRAQIVTFLYRCLGK